MFPPEEGVWGKRGSPIVRAGTGQRRVGGRALWERCRFGWIGPNRFSFQTRMRAWRLLGAGQHQMTYASGEAGRGDGLIYGDGSWRSAQVRLQTRSTFQSVVGWFVSWLLSSLLKTPSCRC